MLCLQCFNIEAYEEDVDHGYQFQVLGRVEKVQRLFYKLLGRMRRALTWQHLVEEDGRLTVADDLTVRGRFEWDEEIDGELPRTYYGTLHARCFLQ